MRVAGRAWSVVSFTLLLVASSPLLAGCNPKPPPPAPNEPAAHGQQPAHAPSPAPAETSLPKAAAAVSRKTTGLFLDRDPRADFRVVSYNVMWNSIFPDVDPENAVKFPRLLQVLQPDILALQEIGRHPRDRDGELAVTKTGADVQKLVSTHLPLAEGERWHVFQGYSNVIVSRWPLRLTAARLKPAGERRLAAALVDLPDARWAVDLYILNNHFKCCGGETNDPLRQKQADALISWLRDAREPGGEIDLPARTPVLLVGDLNIVGGPQPLQTLIDGNIVAEAEFGPDSKPDWDDSDLADAHPRHNLTGADDWTWRDDTGEWPPGRLDYVLYTDSVLEAVKAFALNTTLLSDEELQAAGLQRWDTARDSAGREFDHLPLVVDFRVIAPAGATGGRSAAP